MSVQAGQTAEVTLHVRNFLTQPQKHRIQVQAPHGIFVEPAVLEGSVEPRLKQPDAVESEHGRPT